MQNIGEEIQAEIDQIMDDICETTSDIIVEEATEYFKERFDVKAFDGNPWVPAKRPKKSGSLLVQSSNLVNSIKPIEANKERVVIATTGEVVNKYARTHNEGYEGDIDIAPFTRMAKTRDGKRVEQQVKAHTRHMRIPQRQFMGQAEELNERIRTRVETYIDSINE